MSVFDGTPPFDWVDGTNLEGTLLKSRQMCEAMQALTNRANLVEVDIPDWTAYDYDGTLLHNLGQIPSDNDLRASLLPTREGAYRRNEYFDDLRTALESVLVRYIRIGTTTYTLSTLLQEAVGRSDYNRTLQQLWELPYFDGEDLEEILKCIDLLIEPDQTWYIKGYINTALILTAKIPGDSYYPLFAKGTLGSIANITTGEGRLGQVSSLAEADCDFQFAGSGTSSSALLGYEEAPDDYLALSSDTDFDLPIELTFSVSAARDANDINMNCFMRMRFEEIPTHVRDDVGGLTGRINFRIGGLQDTAEISIPDDTEPSGKATGSVNLGVANLFASVNFKFTISHTP